MPKRYGLKDKDQVIAHIQNLIYSGKLRTGDRVDRNEIAKTLGVSRVPVQEAVVELEHDGVLSTRYHRGVYVERFDRFAVQEYNELRGVLNGLTSARMAADPSDRVLTELDRLLDVMRDARESQAFLEAAWQYRTTIYGEYAGPRLYAAIRALQTFIPTSFWISFHDLRERVLPLYEEEVTAAHRRDPEAARDACTRRSELMGGLLLAELVRRGVIDPAPAEPGPDGPAPAQEETAS